MDVGCSYTMEHPSLAKTVKRLTAGWVSGTDNDTILKRTSLELKALATLYYRQTRMTAEVTITIITFQPEMESWRLRPDVIFMAGLWDYPSRSVTYCTTNTCITTIHV